MTADSGQNEATLTIHVEQAMLEALRQAAAARELAPEALVARWVRERLAHEAERAKGRARQQPPGG